MSVPGFLLLLIAAALPSVAQKESAAEDRRVVVPHGYHIVKRPARSGETPPEVKQEKADEDSRRARQDIDINNQTVPTRAPS